MMDKNVAIEAATALLKLAKVTHEDYYIACGGTVNDSKTTQHLLNGHQVQKMLGISKPTIARLVRDKKLKAIRLTPRNIRYSLDNINELLDKA